jgi:hypothetical protein
MNPLFAKNPINQRLAQEDQHASGYFLISRHYWLRKTISRIAKHADARWIPVRANLAF